MTEDPLSPTGKLKGQGSEATRSLKGSGDGGGSVAFRVQSGPPSLKGGLGSFFLEMQSSYIRRKECICSQDLSFSQVSSVDIYTMN